MYVLGPLSDSLIVVTILSSAQKCIEECGEAVAIVDVITEGTLVFSLQFYYFQEAVNDFVVQFSSFL